MVVVRLGSLLVMLWVLQAAATVSVRDVHDGSLDLATQVETFRHIDRLFPSRIVPHGAMPYAFRQRLAL
jgi:hypothetical protein